MTLQSSNSLILDCPGHHAARAQLKCVHHPAPELAWNTSRRAGLASVRDKPQLQTIYNFNLLSEHRPPLPFRCQKRCIHSYVGCASIDPDSGTATAIDADPLQSQQPVLKLAIDCSLYPGHTHRELCSLAKQLEISLGRCRRSTAANQLMFAGNDLEPEF